MRLSVADSGTGMTPEVMSQVFEPFFTTKEVGKGSGLGLAHTLGFVQASGGGVRVESALGQGTTVSLLLPRSSQAPLGADSVEQRNLTISSLPVGAMLLVEDNQEVAEMTLEMVEQLGYRAIHVSTADEALRELDGGLQVDVVFSDVMMPGAMNGAELARELRSRRPGLPVLLTSGFVDAAKRTADLDDIALLHKPYHLEELAEALLRLRR